MVKIHSPFPWGVELTGTFASCSQTAYSRRDVGDLGPVWRHFPRRLHVVPSVPFTNFLVPPVLPGLSLSPQVLKLVAKWWVANIGDTKVLLI